MDNLKKRRKWLLYAKKGDWEEDPGDEEILAIADSEGRTLVTLDKYFGELAIVRDHPWPFPIPQFPFAPSGYSVDFKKRICQRHSLDFLSVLEILGVKKRALTLKCCGNDERVVEGVLPPCCKTNGVSIELESRQYFA